MSCKSKDGKYFSMYIYILSGEYLNILVFWYGITFIAHYDSK